MLVRMSLMRFALTGVRKFGSIWFTIFAFSPIPITLISLLTRGQSPPTKLGTGSLRTKVAKVLVASVLLSKFFQIPLCPEQS